MDIGYIPNNECSNGTIRIQKLCPLFYNRFLNVVNYIADILYVFILCERNFALSH